jgi:hypothetical protein
MVGYLRTLTTGSTTGSTNHNFTCSFSQRDPFSACFPPLKYMPGMKILLEGFNV